VKIGEVWGVEMALLNAVSEYLLRRTEGIHFASRAAQKTAAVDGMPEKRRHAPTRRFLRFALLMLFPAFVSTALLFGCGGTDASSDNPEGRLVITDDELLLTLPNESTGEPYTAVSSAPIDEDALDDPLFNIGAEPESVGEDDSASPDGDDDGVATDESPDDESLFSLQVGAFIFDRNLEEQARELEEHGFTYYVDETERVVLMYCPIVKEGLSRDGAEAFIERFPADVVDPVMIPTEGERFDVTAGLFYYREDAEAIAENLSDMGYEPTIEERTVEVVIKRLRVGYYEKIEQARSDSRLLENLGYEPIIVKVEQ